MGRGSSDQVRALVSERYVQPALREGKSRFSIAIRDVLSDLAIHGFPPGNTPQVCSALRKKAFLQEHGIEIEGIEGPPSKMSTTVVYHYRRSGHDRLLDATSNSASGKGVPHQEETPEEWAHRVTGKLFGLLKEELAEYGGAEQFMRWVRSDDEGLS